MFFDVGKARTELTAGLQVGIESRVMLQEIAQPALAPYANGAFLFGGQFEIRQETIALLCVGAAHLFKQ